MRSSLQSSGSADVLIVDTLRLSLHVIRTASVFGYHNELVLYKSDSRVSIALAGTVYSGTQA